MKKLLVGLMALLLLLVSVSAESPEEQDRPVAGYVALTFDDGPSGKLTRQLLSGLEERNARATFFLCKYRINRFPEVMELYEAGGHEIGVHAAIHEDLTTMTAEEVRQDMTETADSIHEHTGAWPTIMRPPGGAWNETVRQEAAAAGLRIILWSVDPKDWASHNAAAVLQTMAGRAKNGDIILMHDMSESSVAAALGLVDTLQKQGFCFVTVSELAKLSGVEMVPGEAYKGFRR